MATNTLRESVDDLLDRAGDAIARNDWVLAQQLTHAVLRHVPHHAEASMLLRSVTEYLETEPPIDPFSSSRDLRFVSIMFCDIVGSTALARQLGDVQWRNTLDRFRRRCARAVRRYDGYVHEASGDELLILFGYPRVREDDARRAVLAGLDIIAAIRALSALLEAEHGFPFHARVGIHTGRALIRERGRSEDTATIDQSIGGALVGDAANIAKRIEGAASPDTVWISDTTRRIVEGFFELANGLEGQKQLNLPARSPMGAYQVEQPTPAINRHQIARVRSDQFIGRLDQRQQLLTVWQRAVTDGAPFVVVTGQAGIGKSRFVEFLVETAAANGAYRLEWICTEMLKTVAFAPMIALLERFANIRQTDDGETRLAKLASSLGHFSPGLERFVPHLAWMMSIPLSNQPVEEVEPEATRGEIFGILLDLLTVVSSKRPTVFWIDDVQWADPSTQEFCRRLVAHGPIPGLMTIATMRTMYDRHSDLLWSTADMGHGNVLPLHLLPLSDEEARQLIQSRSSAVDDADRILESAGGNPLYLEEMLRAATAGDEAGAHAVDRVAALPLVMPETLQPIFAHIVDRLGDDRQTAQIASLLGRDLPEPLTRTVIGAILGLSEADVVLRMARLIDAELIEPNLTQLNPGYRFRHDLIREALVHSLGPDATANHRRIAAVIERSYPELTTERPELLAYHFGRGDQHEQAAAYCFKAGLRLQTKAAHQEAIAFFDQGLESLARVARISATPAYTGLEMALCAARGVSVQTTQGYTHPQAGRDWSRAYELSTQTGVKADLVPALGGLWSFYFVKGAHTFVVNLNTTAIDIAQKIIAAAGDESEAQIIGNTCLAYAQYFAGALTDGRDSAELAWRTREANRTRPPEFAIAIPQDPAIAASSLLGPVRWTLGDQIGGLRASEESLAAALALESKRAINVARVGQTNAWLHQIRRDYVKASASAEHALAVAREFRIDWAVVNLSIHRALAWAHIATTAEQRHAALAMARQNIAYWRGSGAETMVPYFLGELADAYRVAGEPAAALELVEEAIALGTANHEHFHDAELYRIRGELRIADAAGRAKGLEDLIEASAIAQRQRALSFEIRALISLLAASLGAADWQRALRRLESALDECQSREASEDERRATDLLTRRHELTRAHLAQMDIDGSPV